MALEAWVAGLSAGSSVLTGGPGDALRGRSRSRSQAAVDCLCFAGARAGGNVGLGCPVRPPIKGRSRTGTDKGNPTV